MGYCRQVRQRRRASYNLGMKDLQAVTEVKAGLDTGWRVLTDFESYPAWNPLLRRIAGNAATGAALRLRVARSLGSDKTMPLPAKVRVCRPQEELAWGGGVPGLFDVHHYFRLEACAAGFRLTHGERFSGVLVGLLWPLLRARIRPENYQALNEAFRKRCEELAALR